jgi:hypothetical protein
MSSLLFLFATVACTTGANYPEQFASAYCETAYKCMNNSDIETFTGYDDVEDCKLDWTAEMMNTSDYEAWEEGDMAFDREKANACLTEITEVQQDSDCDGSMNVFDFFNDTQSGACDDVYYTKE